MRSSRRGSTTRRRAAGSSDSRGSSSTSGSRIRCPCVASTSSSSGCARASTTASWTARTSSAARSRRRARRRRRQGSTTATASRTPSAAPASPCRTSASSSATGSSGSARLRRPAATRTTSLPPEPTDGLRFDEGVAAQLEAFYRSRDVLRRRSLAGEALGAEPGDAVLDVGCGPGFYLLDALERVGPDGAVTGVDASPAMLAIADRRVGSRPNARVLEGTATELPVEDAHFDRALSVQVFEYLPDVDAALAEMKRAVKPGGRVVIWDIDWTTLSWHSSDSGRMGRVLEAWDRHLANPALPRTLHASLH